MMISDELYGQLRKDHFIFAGPCALESFELALDTAHAVAEASREAGLSRRPSGLRKTSE